MAIGLVRALGATVQEVSPIDQLVFAHRVTLRGRIGRRPTPGTTATAVNDAESLVSTSMMCAWSWNVRLRNMSDPMSVAGC